MSFKQIYRACFVSFALCAVVASCSKRPAQIVVEAGPASASEKRAEVSFGRRQIDQMLADRPDMVGVLDDNDPVLLWIVSSMNGERIGQRVYWNGEAPASGAPSEFLAPYEYYPPHICLTKGTEATGVDKWACLVFELFNLENTKEFADLQAKAIAGTLTGDAYATECANLEYIALKKARKFFEEHPLPVKKPDIDRHYARFLKTPETFAMYMGQFIDWNGKFQSPGAYFKKYYDEELGPRAGLKKWLGK